MAGKKRPIDGTLFCGQAYLRRIDPIWMPGPVLPRFWEDHVHRRDYLLWAAHRLGLRTMQDLYRLRLTPCFKKNYGAGLIRYWGRSALVAVEDCFPQHDWEPSLFGEAACRGKKRLGSMIERAELLKQCDGAAVVGAKIVRGTGRCLGPGLLSCAEKMAHLEVRTNRRHPGNVEQDPRRPGDGVPRLSGRLLAGRTPGPTVRETESFASAAAQRAEDPRLGRRLLRGPGEVAGSQFRSDRRHAGDLEQYRQRPAPGASRLARRLHPGAIAHAAARRAEPPPPSAVQPTAGPRLGRCLVRHAAKMAQRQVGTNPRRPGNLACC